MKAAYESVQHLPAASFTVRRFEEKQFSAPYHYHPEFELTFIEKGHGKRYIGGRMDDYRAGDLVLLGEHLPHCWKTDAGQPEAINAVSVVIHFRRNFPGDAFFLAPEMKAVNKLLKLAMNGLHFGGAAAAETGRQMALLLQEQNGVRRIGRLLEILNSLALCNDFSVLEQQNLYEHIAVVEREKINRITAYVVERFKEPVTVEQAAALVNMSPHAFCRYFKRITRRTFIEMVIDYRIDYAAQQLIYTDLPITQVAFESGFSDISNFYRTFRARKHSSPRAYHRAFLKQG